MRTHFKRLFLSPVIFMFSGILILSSCNKGEKKEETTTEDTTKDTTTSAVGETGAEELEYAIDTAKSVIKWKGKKVTGSHNGYIKLQSGTLKAKGESITSGKIVINLKSIVDEDLKNKKENQKLIGHLKGEDFFNVEKYPTATYTIEGSSPGETKEQQILTGKLEMKGKTEPMSFPIEFKLEEGKLIGKGKAILDRTKWEMKYGSGKFFEGLGDKVIYDEVDLEFEIEATK